MNQQSIRRFGARPYLSASILAALAMTFGKATFSQDAARSEATTGFYQGVLLDARKTDVDTVRRWREKDFRIVLMVREVDAQLRSAASLVKSQQHGEVEYFFEIAHSPQLAKQHPVWMASLQGHRRFGG